IVPELIQAHQDGSPLRVWVPGCSTGEEVYSIAVVIREYLEDEGIRLPVQIFGTDISDAAISAARAARYTEAEVRNVSPERIRRFFLTSDGGYMVHKQVRDMCIFARQNIARDAPFSKLDLISCRNLMIYLSPP